MCKQICITQLGIQIFVGNPQNLIVDSLSVMILYQVILCCTEEEIRCVFDMSLVVRKPAFCLCENKDADQLRSNCAADQRFCFHHIDSTIPLLSKSEISSL